MNVPHHSQSIAPSLRLGLFQHYTLSLTADLLSLTLVCSFPYFPNAFWNLREKNGVLCFMPLQIGEERLLHSKESEKYEYRSAGSCYNPDFAG